MKNLLRALFIFLYLDCSSQNLVKNSSFENYDSLPCNFIITAVQFSQMLLDWTVPNHTTPDLCSPLIPNICRYGNPYSSQSAGVQLPRTGNVMIGMVCENGGYNEYIQVPLITPLVIGNSYEAEVYVSLAAKSDFANNNIGMYFSEHVISDSNFQSSNYIPTVLDTTTISDTLNWVKVSGCFTASKAAKYLIIGNFNSSCSNGIHLGGGWPMAYYFFDDVSVKPIAFCNYEQKDCLKVLTSNEKIKIYPNPFASFVIIENGEIGAVVEILDILGRKLKSQKILTAKDHVNLEILPSAPYILIYRGSSQQIFKLVKLK